MRLASVTMSAFAVVHSARAFVASRRPAAGRAVAISSSKPVSNRATGRVRVTPRGNHCHRTRIDGRGGQRRRLCATRVTSAESTERCAAGAGVGAAASGASGVHKLGRGNEVNTGRIVKYVACVRALIASS